MCECVGKELNVSGRKKIVTGLHVSYFCLAVRCLAGKLFGLAVRCLAGKLLWPGGEVLGW